MLTIISSKAYIIMFIQNNHQQQNTFLNESQQRNKTNCKIKTTCTIL